MAETQKPCEIAEVRLRISHPDGREFTVEFGQHDTGCVYRHDSPKSATLVLDYVDVGNIYLWFQEQGLVLPGGDSLRTFLLTAFDSPDEEESA